MVDTRYLTVMFTDIKGFTERTSASTREDLVQLLKNHEDLVLPILEQHSGTLVKTIGDAFLVTFASPTNAVLAGIDIQAALGSFNAGVAESEKIEIRVALNSGEVTELENDVFGDAVNITSRIEKLAEANEIFLSEAVYLAVNRQELNRTSQRAGFKLSDMGRHALKGIAHPIRIYSLHRGLRSASDTARQALGVQGDAEFLLQAAPDASIPLAPLPLEQAVGRSSTPHGLPTRRRTTASSVSYRIKPHRGGLGAGLALTPITLLAILVLGIGALLQSVWLSLVALLLLVASLPFKLGRGYTGMTLLRGACVALLVPLFIFFATAMLRDVQRRVSTIDAKLMSSSRVLSVRDLATVVTFNLLRTADLLWAGRSAAAKAHALLLLPSDSKKLWLDDQPMQGPAIRKSIGKLFATARRNSKNVSVLPEISLDHAGQNWPGFEQISDFRVTGKALRSDSSWKLQLIGSGQFGYLESGTVCLIDGGQTVVTMPARLGWAAQQQMWLHPFRARWAWDVDSDDPRLIIPRR